MSGLLLLFTIAAATVTLARGWPQHAFDRAPEDAAVTIALWLAWSGAAMALTHLWRQQGSLAVAISTTAFVWGLTAAPVLADWMDGAWGRESPWIDVVAIAPLDETIAQGIGTALVLLTTGRTVTVLDGLLTGVTVGIGFTVIEGWAYTMAGRNQPIGFGWDLVDNLWIRGVADMPSGHLVFSGIVGAGIAALLARRHRLHGGVLIVTGVILHSIHNAIWSRGVGPAAAVVAVSVPATAFTWRLALTDDTAARETRSV